MCIHLYVKIAIVVQSKHSLIKLASYGLEWQYCSINTISRILNSCKCLIVKTCFCYDIERVNVFVGRISNKLCTLRNLFLRIDFQWQMLQHVTTRISNEGILSSYSCEKVQKYLFLDDMYKLLLMINLDFLLRMIKAIRKFYQLKFELDWKWTKSIFQYM